MTNMEAGALLVQLYGRYRNMCSMDSDYEEAIAKAVAALGVNSIGSFEMRKCCGTWVYCNGFCADCYKNKVSYSNKTES